MSTDRKVRALRNPSPTDLRQAATVKNATWLPVLACAGPMLADAIEIADSCARADIECHCTWEHIKGERWYDTRVTEERETEPIAQAVRYLEARGLLVRKPGQPELVRLDAEAA